MKEKKGESSNSVMYIRLDPLHRSTTDRALFSPAPKVTETRSFGLQGRGSHAMHIGEKRREVSRKPTFTYAPLFCCPFSADLHALSRVCGPRFLERGQGLLCGHPQSPCIAWSWGRGGKTSRKLRKVHVRSLFFRFCWGSGECCSSYLWFSRRSIAIDS